MPMELCQIALQTRIPNISSDLFGSKVFLFSLQNFYPYFTIICLQFTASNSRFLWEWCTTTTTTTIFCRIQNNIFIVLYISWKMEIMSKCSKLIISLWRNSLFYFAFRSEQKQTFCIHNFLEISFNKKTKMQSSEMTSCVNMVRIFKERT